MTSINIDCRRKKITHKSKQNKIKPSTAVFFSRGKIYFKKEKKKSAHLRRAAGVFYSSTQEEIKTQNCYFLMKIRKLEKKALS